VNKVKLACCGDVCDLCPRYTATLSGDKEKLKAVAVLLKKVGWRDRVVSEEEVICQGCETYKGDCEFGVRECCLEKNIGNCGECDDYPCDKIQRAFEINRENAEKFKRILSSEEYEIFDRAFFSKKENLLIR
jgi:hypothetical protein